MPATLPHHLRSHWLGCNCLHATPPLGSPLAIPTTRSSPARNRPSPQHPTPSMHSRRLQAPTHSAADADARSVQLRSSFVSCVILPRLGASDAAPSSPNLLSAGIRRPSARPSQAPPPATVSRTTAPAHSTQHHQHICRRSQASAHSAGDADAHSVPLRFSSVSCVILTRLGASDAAPSSPMAFTAR